MNFGLDVPIAGEFADPQRLVELAVEAEGRGWSGFFLQDHLVSDQPVLDPWIALAAIAAATRRIKLGIFMTPLARRRPWKVARETVTLDRLSQGRLILGCGLGFNPADFSTFGEPAGVAARARKLDEALEIICGLWSGRPCSFSGEFFEMAETTFLPTPLQTPRIPVWVSGGWPNKLPFQRAARWDGIYVMTMTGDGDILQPEEFAAIHAALRRWRKLDQPLEIAFAMKSPPDPEKAGMMVAPYADYGVTWWLEGLWSMGSEEARKRILAGPPALGTNGGR